MDRIQRVRRAIAGLEVDRIPAGFWTHFPPAAATGRAMADAHLDFYRRSGVDFVKVMNDNPYRLVGLDRVDRASDWRRLRPEPRGSQGRLAYLDGLKAILDAVGHEALVIATVFNPFATANDNRSGSLDFSDLTFDGISALSTASRPAIEREVREAVAVAGARGFMLGAGCAVTGEVDPEVFAWAREAATA